MFHHKSFGQRSFSARAWRFSGVLAADLPPVFRRSGPLRITPAHRRKIQASAAVAWGFTVSARAALSLGGEVTTPVLPAAQSSAALALSAHAAGEVTYNNHGTADAADVVLEAVMMTL